MRMSLFFVLVLGFANSNFLLAMGNRLSGKNIVKKDKNLGLIPSEVLIEFLFKYFNLPFLCKLKLIDKEFCENVDRYLKNSNSNNMQIFPIDIVIKKEEDETELHGRLQAIKKFVSTCMQPVYLSFSQETFNPKSQKTVKDVGEIIQCCKNLYGLGFIKITDIYKSNANIINYIPEIFGCFPEDNNLTELCVLTNHLFNRFQAKKDLWEAFLKKLKNLEKFDVVIPCGARKSDEFLYDLDPNKFPTEILELTLIFYDFSLPSHCPRFLKKDLPKKLKKLCLRGDFMKRAPNGDLVVHYDDDEYSSALVDGSGVNGTEVKETKNLINGPLKDSLGYLELANPNLEEIFFCGWIGRFISLEALKYLVSTNESLKCIVIKDCKATSEELEKFEKEMTNTKGIKIEIREINDTKKKFRIRKFYIKLTFLKNANLL